MWLANWSDFEIAGATLFEAAIPLREPFRISGGVMSVRRSLIVALEAGPGRVGYGESAPFELPFYSGETLTSARWCLEEVLLPRVVGRRFGHPAELHECLREGIRENAMARAGVETAWWDLCARRGGVFLGDLVLQRLTELGAPKWSLERRPNVASGVALGIPDDGSMAGLTARVEAAAEEGFRRVKIKVRPGWDVEPTRAALEVLARSPNPLPLWVDANGAYDRTAHVEVLAALDQLGVVFVEQPFHPDALWDSTVWNRSARTPVCLDESLTSDDVARQVLEMQGPTIWNLKVQRLGGLEETCRVYARGAAAGMQMWVGTMPESGIGAQSALAVAQFAGCVFPSDVEPSWRWYQTNADLVELEMSPEGTIPAVAAYVNPPMDRLEVVADIR